MRDATPGPVRVLQLRRRAAKNGQKPATDRKPATETGCARSPVQDVPISFREKSDHMKEVQQNDDRDRNAEKPEQYTAHVVLQYLADQRGVKRRCSELLGRLEVAAKQSGVPKNARTGRR
jgi:hypothetical protein